MKESEVMLEPDAFEAVRRGLTWPIKIEDGSIKMALVFEVESGRRTGRWIAFEVLDMMIRRPPLAACLARNAAAARLAREELT